MGGTASRHQDHVDKPYFYATIVSNSPPRCALLEPRLTLTYDINGLQNADPNFPTGILEPIRDRGTCLDALVTIQDMPDVTGITNLETLPGDAQCSGCFRTKDGKFYFCDYDPSLGYEGHRNSDDSYAKPICILSVSPSPPPPSPPSPAMQRLVPCMPRGGAMSWSDQRHRGRPVRRCTMASSRV